MNDTYKTQHKPVTNSDKVKFHQGYFIPKNPEKWLTSQNIYRSSWEFKFLTWMDNNPRVVRAASEPCAVKYKNPVSNIKWCVENNLDPKNPANWKVCNYYTDMWMEMLQNDGTVKKIFVEIKPYDQTQPPKPINESASLKEKKAFNRAAETFLVNQAKWTEAAKYFQSMGASFIIVTEKTLSKMGLLND